MISPKAEKDRKKKPVPIPLPVDPKPTGRRYHIKGSLVADFSGWDGNQDISSFGLAGLYTRASLGRDYTDPTFAWYREQASKNGICFGAYHFWQPNNLQQQVDNFVRVALGVDWLILDAEYTPPAWPLGIRGEALANQYKFWLDGVEKATGKRPWIYTNQSCWSWTYYDPTGKKNRNNYQPPLWSKDYKLIVAWYPNQPDAWPYPPTTAMPSGFTDIPLWQYADSGRSNGYKVNDLNVWLK